MTGMTAAAFKLSLMAAVRVVRFLCLLRFLCKLFITAVAGEAPVIVHGRPFLRDGFFVAAAAR